jgi:hypothetical protein
MIAWSAAASSLFNGLRNVVARDGDNPTLAQEEVGAAGSRNPS